MAGLLLPEAPKVLGNYQPYVIRNGIGVISGQFPIQGGKLLYQGKIGEELSISDAKHAIEIATLNVLSQLSNASNGFADLDGILRIDAYIASGHGFDRHAEVVDVASNLLMAALGNKGCHARSAIGVPQLPLNSSIELVVSFSIIP